MDRSILEGDPFSVLEGMLIGAAAVGATRGFIYVRGEYPLAVQQVKAAIAEMKKAGLLGKNIFGTGFGFTVAVEQGAGAFVCGEETALIASIEGRTGEPVQRPPYPAEQGLMGRPTCINNVETLANIPVIIARGGAWFAGIGKGKSRGTKVFSLVGSVNRVGLIEVPMGTPLTTIINDIGGGIPGRRKLKAVQTGGPSGGCIPARFCGLGADYESLTAAGSIMGSGGMIVMDDRTCMVDVAKYFMGFLKEESCGKCLPCRQGTQAIYDILERITGGRGRQQDIARLKEIADAMEQASLCGLGKTAANPVLSTLRYFAGEYAAHIKQSHCPAGVCTALIRFSINRKKCTGCGACRKACPAGAVTGTAKKPHAISAQECTRCRACFEVCPADAIEIR
jgi:NADH:ubiquinone oxidoreductase subunit F (NADH-binding)